MAEKEMKIIIQIIGVIAVVLCGISLIVPWAGVNAGGYGTNAYLWGWTSYSPTTSEWDFFFIDVIDSSVTEAIVFSISMIIAFILTLVALIIGIVGVIRISKKPSNSLLAAGIISIVAMIFCIIAVAQVNNQYTTGIGFEYSSGFILIILSFIFYIITYVLQKVLLTYVPAPVGIQPTYQQPQYGQPHMMYNQQPQQQPMQTPQSVPQQYPTPQPQQPQTQPKVTPNFCQDCGAPLKPGYQFCDKCGKKFF